MKKEMKKVSLRQALKALGYEVVQYHNNYNYRSGFMRKDGIIIINLDKKGEII